ncbi:MAG: hypothetical protein IPK26_04310 [Planctomycetes bacterium]|nr:hypothetical protein [Planctomycetota bacterium]
MAIALVAAELVLRLTWTPAALRSTPAFVEHPVYGFAPAPSRRGRHVTPEYGHAFAHNAQGWRRRESITAALPAGKQHRVLLLGDSFTYGLGVDDDATFAARLQEALPTVDVINAGCNGMGQREQLAVLDQLGAATRPDVVVVNFFWNDLTDNLRRHEPAFALQDGRVVRVPPVDAAFAPLALLSEPEWQRPSAWTTSYLQQFVKEELKAARYRWFGIRDRFVASADERDAAWAVTGELLGLLRTRAAEIGATLLVTCLPDHNQVDPTAVIANLGEAEFGVQERLQAACSGIGVICIDLLPPMRDRFTRIGQPLFWFADRHLNVLGHQVVAEALLPVLQAEIGSK